MPTSYVIATVNMTDAAGTQSRLIITDSIPTENFPLSTAPKERVYEERSGPRHGSGPYYRSVERPYLASITCDGKTRRCDYGWSQIDTRASRFGVRYVSYGDFPWDPSDSRHIDQRNSRLCQITETFTDVTMSQGKQMTLDAWMFTQQPGVETAPYHAQLSITLGINGRYAHVDWSKLSPDQCAQLICQFAHEAGFTPGKFQSSTKYTTYLDGYTQVTLAYSGRGNGTRVYSCSCDWKFDETPHTARHLEWRTMIDGGYIPGRIANLTALAYQESLAGLPEVTCNSIANVCEIAEALTTVSGAIRAGSRVFTSYLEKRARTLVDPRQDWLTWRYVYNTTKMDLAEYKSVTDRLIKLANLCSSTFSTRGTASDGELTVRCVEQWNTADFDVGSYDTRRLLETYGFKLSAYNAWDMIPFSFMADWFLHIGDLLEHTEEWAKRQRCRSVGDVWFSVSQNTEHGYVYYRWRNIFPTLQPHYDRKVVSDRTLVYRLADTVSIFS